MADVTALVPADELRDHLRELFVALGVPTGQAAIVADNLVEADLRGVDSHGAHLVPLYVERLRGGHLQPATNVTVVHDEGSTVLLDGGLGFGQVAGVAAIDLAVERAAEHGCAVVSVRESTHLGALGYFTSRAATRGYIAMAFQNGPTIVPPFGGLTGVFSTNPLSYAVPTRSEATIVYDVATTTVAGNKVLLAKKRGEPTIPEGWARDVHGRPTTSTEEASVRHLDWFGGHKGYGLAFLVEVLAGILTDSSFGRTERTASPLAGPDRVAKGYTFWVLNVDRFLPVRDFRERVDALVRDARSSERADGVRRIYFPGEIEALRRAARARDGIPIPEAVVAELDAFAADLGVAPLARAILP